jgi:hypothetical protein
MAKNATLGNNLVDKLLPTVGKLRTSLFAKMGVRQFRVFTVRRTWDGGRRGEGTPTETEVELTPPPQVSPGLTYKMEPCGLNEAGAVILREVDLRYTEDELDGKPTAASDEFFYRIKDGQGQSIRDRAFQLARPPFPDREDTIGWIIHLTPSTEDD